MREFLILTAIAAALGVGYSLYTHQQAAEPITYVREPEPEEPELCFVENVVVPKDGYGIFTDYDAKTYIFARANGTVDIYEEAAPDRHNCTD